MNVKEVYEKLDGDYEGMKATMPKDEFIEEFLLKFLNEPSYNRLMNAVETDDIEESFSAAHTLKGVIANLRFPKLYNALVLLTEQLRPCTESADTELLEQVKKYYTEIVETIKKEA